VERADAVHVERADAVHVERADAVHLERADAVHVERAGAVQMERADAVHLERAGAVPLFVVVLSARQRVGDDSVTTVVSVVRASIKSHQIYTKRKRAFYPYY